MKGLDLTQRLAAYQESTKSTSVRHGGANWAAYAAAAGSALAMASNASANTIYYSGVLNAATGPVGNNLVPIFDYLIDRATNFVPVAAPFGIAEHIYARFLDSRSLQLGNAYL